MSDQVRKCLFVFVSSIDKNISQQFHLVGIEH